MSQTDEPSVEDCFPALHGILDLHRNPTYWALREKDIMRFGIAEIGFAVYINAAAGLVLTLEGAIKASLLKMSDGLDACVFLAQNNYLTLNACDDSCALWPTAELMRAVEQYFDDLRRAR